MDRLEHIGIAVKNLDQANKIFADLLGKKHYKIEEVATEGVRTSFFEIGGVKIELIEATREDSAITTFIEKRGEGLHHLAFHVADIHDEMKTCRDRGFTFTRETPFRGADNKMVCFLHPKSTNGVLVELCQPVEPA